MTATIGMAEVARSAASAAGCELATMMSTGSATRSAAAWRKPS
jgi:hypothetical protein